MLDNVAEANSALELPEIWRVRFLKEQEGNDGCIGNGCAIVLVLLLIGGISDFARCVSKWFRSGATTVAQTNSNSAASPNDVTDVARAKNIEVSSPVSEAYQPSKNSNLGAVETDKSQEERLLEFQVRAAAWEDAVQRREEDEKELKRLEEQLATFEKVKPSRDIHLERDWHSADYKFKTTAKLISHDTQTITLRKQNGTDVNVSIDSVSGADKFYLDHVALTETLRYEKRLAEWEVSKQELISSRNSVHERLKLAETPRPSSPSTSDMNGEIVGSEVENRINSKASNSRVGQDVSSKDSPRSSTTSNANNSLTQKQLELAKIKSLRPQDSMIQVSLYLSKYDPSLSDYALFHRNAWQDATFAGDLGQMRVHYAALKSRLGTTFLGFYWDVDEIMTDSLKLKKILQESKSFREFQNQK
jgi:hypothetical protein